MDSLFLPRREITPLAPQRVRARQEQPPLLVAMWAPKTDSIAFVFHNDLYFTTSPTLSTMYRITSSGQIGTIFNGVPDWVYEGIYLLTLYALTGRIRPVLPKFQF